MTFDDLIALPGMMGHATDTAGNFVTPRPTALDKQIGYLAKAYRGITFQRNAGETVLLRLADTIRNVLGNCRTDHWLEESIPWEPEDLCGVTTVYARATHGALEAAVEKLIEPIGQVVEFERKTG